MNKSKKFILNVLILSITTFILKTVNVSFTVYLSNKIGAEGIGVFQLIMSVYMFAITLSISGIGFTTTRLISEELALSSHKGIKSAMKKCMFYSLFFSVLSAILFSINADLIARVWLHGEISAMPIHTLAISLPFLSLSSVFSGYFTAVRRVIKSASAQLIEQFIKIFITVYLLGLFLPKGLEYACLSLVLGGTIAEVLSCIYLYILYLFDKEKYKNNALITFNLTKKMLGISLPVAFSSYLRSALSTFKQIVIPTGLEKSGLSCKTALSQYGLISGMVMPILFFPSAILSAVASIIVPEISENFIKKRDSRISSIISRIFKITLLSSICVSGIFSYYSNELSLAIYKNLDSAFFIKVLSPLIVIMYLDEIVDAILKGLNKQVTVVYINILDSVVSIALLYTLLPFQGIKGYILVIFISEIFNGFLSINKLMKVANFEIKFLWWIVVPTLAMSISIIFTKSFITVNLPLSIVCSILIYLIILSVVDFFTKSISFLSFRKYFL